MELSTAASWLEGTTLAQLLSSRPRRRPIHQLEHSQTVAEALTALHDHDVLSAPLVSEPLALPEALDGGDHVTRVDQEVPTFLGFLDVGDLLAALVRELPAGTHTEQEWFDVLTAVTKRAFMSRKLIAVASRGDGDLVFQGSLQASLRRLVLDGFLRGGAAADTEHVNHRIAVFDGHGRISDVVSQLDVVRFVSAHASDALGDLRFKSVAALLRTQRDVVTVDENTPTVEAFRTMLDRAVSGVGVTAKPPRVGSPPVLVGSLSASDVRGLLPEHLTALGLPVREFLELLHGERYASAQGQVRRSSWSGRPAFFPDNRARGPPGLSLHLPLVTYTSATRLDELIVALVQNKVHRAWLIDENGSVSGVCTLTDVLRLLAE